MSAKLKAERDEARSIVRDIHWMAVRYADNRKSYAVGMCNDALRKAYEAGWLTYTRDNGKLDPQYARDGLFDREWVSALDNATARAEKAESALASSQEEIERLRKALEPFGRPNDIDPSLPDSTWLGVKYEDVFVAHCHAGDFRRAARALSPSEEQGAAPRPQHEGME
ncbi:hypothetical protein [Mesorhizobium sp. B2-3-2]|uniref:hypothetical protein n=1 Tax=Mesorhizobium sp. B2-3-2 TaxID=2589961 RepID=UPI00112738FE|nr:hypothetical protein [Mesorhizobium sp. B2-3-2]TPM37015.1 hypothetical protein FJ964_30225 [Mesorhizobium sp. B2-3-2]